jgi:hypothetical protein
MWKRSENELGKEKRCKKEINVKRKKYVKMGWVRKIKIKKS